VIHIRRGRVDEDGIRRFCGFSRPPSPSRIGSGARRRRARRRRVHPGNFCRFDGEPESASKRDATARSFRHQSSAELACASAGLNKVLGWKGIASKSVFRRPPRWTPFRTSSGQWDHRLTAQPRAAMTAKEARTFRGTAERKLGSGVYRRTGKRSLGRVGESSRGGPG